MTQKRTKSWNQVSVLRSSVSRTMMDLAHLAFSQCFDVELKMLYTAITRARVNVFIAESDLSYCRPVFNYFKSRKLVDEMGKGDPCAIRIFGKLNTDHDWKTRGEYYLKMALGQRENVGCLRLAAKCFERVSIQRCELTIEISLVSFLPVLSIFV